jgi:hypothetical protein
MITQESLHFELQPSLKRISTDECKQKEKLKRMMTNQTRM